MTLGSAGLIIPLLGLGILGQRRRVADYAAGMGFQPLHIITAVAGLLVFGGVVILIINIVRSLKTGDLAGDNPWNSRTLEWQVSSPPPEDNFAEIPTIVGDPYAYGVPGATYAVMGGGVERKEGT
jgi:heme/copper-type cytochrome/quinol oxidase subunit 1